MQKRQNHTRSADGQWPVSRNGGQEIWEEKLPAAKGQKAARQGAGEVAYQRVCNRAIQPVGRAHLPPERMGETFDGYL